MHSTTEAPKKSNSILDLLPGSLPKAKIPPNVDLEGAASQVLKLFPRLQKHHFTPDALWRDTYALTGTIRTFYFDSSVASTWASLSDSHGLLDTTLVPGSVKVMKPEAGVEWIDCTFTFKTLTPATECSGILSLVPSDDGQWRIWVLRTFLEQLSGHGNVDKLDPANGDDEKNGNSDTTEDHHYSFGAVVIGGGQSGLSVGGRLKALGVSYVILEKNAQVGDAWKLRYESARCKFSPSPIMLKLSSFSVTRLADQIPISQCTLFASIVFFQSPRPRQKANATANWRSQPTCLSNEPLDPSMTSTSARMSWLRATNSGQRNTA